MVKLDRSNKQRAVLCATYPTAELSVVQRPWGFLFEVGMRFSFIKFNLDDYEVSPFDQVTQSFGRKRVVAPYLFVDVGPRLF